MASSSVDGSIWTEPYALVPPFRYIGEDKVSVFSLSKDSDGSPVVALKSSENTVEIYKQSIPGAAMDRISVLDSGSSSVVPRIFRKKDGGLLLFLTAKVILPNGTDALSIYFSESPSGEIWTTSVHFIRNPELKQNFLPFYTFDSQGEYVVFQSLYTDQRNTYQLYLKTRGNGEEIWSDEKLITSFSEFRNGENFDFFQYDNQRPHLTAENGLIHLVWERRLGREMPQIYYGIFDRNGETAQDVEQISRGTFFTAYPRIILEKEESLILWFDNRNGNQVVMAQKKGVFWQENRVSLMNGDSTYGSWIRHNGDLFIFWENQNKGNRNITVLTPDRSAESPIIRTVNFRDGGRQADDRAVISWRRPEDSSGILGFSYAWDKNPDTQPDREPDLLDLRERTETFRALDDGDWYFHISLVDYAGNWSDTLHIKITRDTVPPDPL